MKSAHLLKRTMLPAALIGGLSGASAQLDLPNAESPNRFGLSFRMAFNVKVDFENVGAFPSPAGLRTTPDGAPFNYDDGYVLTDSSGNLLGYTRYWGYDSASQVPGDGTIVMHTTSSAGASVAAPNENPELGFELTYNRELGRNKTVRWGVESAFNYMNVAVNDSGPVAISASRVSTPYQLPSLEGGGFVSPPPAPYYHGADLSTNGNPVINTTPLPSGTAEALVAMAGTRDFDADIFGFRVGPYLELSLGEKTKLSLSGGLALALVTSEFSFNETIAQPNVPPASGSGSQQDVLVGGYVAGNIAYKLAPNWDLFGGVQFQKVGQYSQTVNGETAVLDLSQSIFVVVGASYSF
jgi:hypothetical protein